MMELRLPDISSIIDAVGLKRCRGCGGLILGVYLRADGEYWHPEHFTCDMCGAVMTGPYAINEWGDRYCQRHWGDNEGSVCYSCQRPISTLAARAGTRYRDGRALCASCYTTAVDDQAVADRIVGEMRVWMATRGLRFGPARMPVRLVDRFTIRSRSGRVTPLGRVRSPVAVGARGTTEAAGTGRPQATTVLAADPCGLACMSYSWAPGSGERRQVESILILYGLPELRFRAVAAHELCHAWLFLNYAPRLRPFVEEGVCELVAAAWLYEQEGAAAEWALSSMYANADPVYGDGYRAALRAIHGKSLAQVVRYVRLHGQLPG